MAKNNKGPVFQTNAGANPMGAPAKNASPSATTNQKIQQAISGSGNNLNYREASSVAQTLGVSVDRVYNQTAKTGQNAVAGSFAANANYIPSNQLKVASPLTPDYAAQAAVNAKAQLDAARTPADPNADPNAVIPQFDWDAWNAQMMAQQAAIWESMDAMNSEFMRKQQDWFAQREQLTGTQVSRGSAITSSLPGDKASVKRKKRTTATSTNAAANGLNTSSSGNSVSLGGGQTNSGGLSIGKG